MDKAGRCLPLRNHKKEICVWKVNKSSHRTWRQGQCGCKHDRKCISNNIYLLPGKLFRDKFIRVWPNGFRGVGKQIRMANRTGTCHGSTAFYVPVRLLRIAHNSSQITDHYPSAAKPWTCAIKLDPLLFWFPLTVYAVCNLWTSRLISHSRSFWKTVSVFSLEINH
jgi:hypothetical protein